ncbi:MAG: FAD-dependent oxidoreductase [Caulobacter sp.]|nr:FAD-dependent oxidoreductase [Caulobacter sp.]
MMETVDYLVVGAGVAGASVAAELADRARVCLIEQEEQPGYHATGRSAAIFARNYGVAAVRALTQASETFFKTPPAGFAQAPLFKPRQILEIGREDQLGALAASAAAAAGVLTTLSRSQVLALAPMLRPHSVAAGLLDPAAGDLDVHELLSGWLRLFKARGGRLMTGAALLELSRKDGGWRARTARGEVQARVVVNAAGAWADGVAELAGAAALGLTPRRRTGVMVDAPPGAVIDDWPMVVDADELFYFKPDAGRIMLSPGDATATAPCDAAPEELDVAVAIDRVLAATTLDIRRVRSRWAGLRTFAPDEHPVVGFDVATPGFFWLAGQGGFGIQTAPALSLAAAALIRGEPLPEALIANGVDARALSPGRLIPGSAAVSEMGDDIS